MGTPSQQTVPPSLLSTFEYAQEILTGITDAVAAAGGQFSASVLALQTGGITDAINDPTPANRDYAGIEDFSALPGPSSWPPPPGYMSIFELRGTAVFNSVSYNLAVTLAPFALRNAKPDQEQYDRNYYQTGGPNNVNVPVAGCAISFKLATDGNVATPYYGAPGSTSTASTS